MHTFEFGVFLDLGRLLLYILVKADVRRDVICIFLDVNIRCDM